MEWTSVIADLLSPPILFFVMGVVIGLLRSDLAFPESAIKLLSLYLMWAIGIKGGIKLREAGLTAESLSCLFAAITLALVIPGYVYMTMRRRLGPDDAAAISAVYGSVSAVTFLTACAFLQRKNADFDGHMVAALALMESPAILVAVLFSRRAAADGPMPPLAESIRESALNGPVVLLTGSMAIGAICGQTAHDLLKPLYIDLFPGILTFFLLELGLVAARRGRVLTVLGLRLTLFGVLFPVVNATAALLLARLLHLEAGNAFLLMVLAASASYIAAPAAIQHAIPRANPGIYIPLALAVTFPFNITIGLPLYWAIVRWIWPQ